MYTSWIYIGLHCDLIGALWKEPDQLPFDLFWTWAFGQHFVLSAKSECCKLFEKNIKYYGKLICWFGLRKPRLPKEPKGPFNCLLRCKAVTKDVIKHHHSKTVTKVAVKHHHSINLKDDHFYTTMGSIELFDGAIAIDGCSTGLLPLNCHHWIPFHWSPLTSTVFQWPSPRFSMTVINGFFPSQRPRKASNRHSHFFNDKERR